MKFSHGTKREPNPRVSPKNKFKGGPREAKNEFWGEGVKNPQIPSKVTQNHKKTLNRQILKSKMEALLSAPSLGPPLDNLTLRTFMVKLDDLKKFYFGSFLLKKVLKPNCSFYNTLKDFFRKTSTKIWQEKLDAKTTQSYFLCPTSINIIMWLPDLWWQNWSKIPPKNLVKSHSRLLR